MKKLFGITIFLITLVFLGACSQLDNAQFKLVSDQDVFSYQALATSSLLSAKREVQVKQGNDFTLTNLTTLENQEETTEDLVDEVKVLEPYLGLIEKFITGKNGLEVKNETSDLEEFEHKLVFTTFDLLEKETVYTLYYNQTVTEEDDDEVEYELDGLLVFNEQRLKVTGTKEVEEDETKIEFTAYKDEHNYVTSEYEFEDDETKFTFKEYKDGVLYSESEIKIEIEDNETEIELFYFFKGNTYRYEFEFEGSTLEIEYETSIDGVKTKGKIEVLVSIDELTGQATYKILVDEDFDGITDHEYERERDDEDDDDDDEDDDES